MAEEKEIILSIKTDTSAAGAGVDELKSKIEGVNNTPMDKPFKNFKQEIKEAITDAQKLEAQFGRNSVEFTNAAKKVAELKDRFGEFNQSIAGFNPDNKLQALVSVSAGAIGAIQGVTGAMTFLGVESDTANVAVAKLQGLMAFSDALGKIDDIKNGFKTFGSVIQSTTFFQKANSAATVAATAVQKLFGASVIGTGRAFNVLKGAIVATGIGALIVGLGMLADKLGVFSDAADEAADSQEKLNEKIADAKRFIDEYNKSTQVYIDRTIKQVKNEETIKDLQARGTGLKEINRLKRENIEIELQNLKTSLYSKDKLLNTQEELALKSEIYKKERELNRLGIEEEKKANDERKKIDAENKLKADKKLQDDIQRTKDGFNSILKGFEDEENATRIHYENLNDIAAEATEQKIKDQEEAKQRILDAAASKTTFSDAGVIKAERQNAPDEEDPAEEAKSKLQIIFQAQLEAEDANFLEKKLRAEGNAAELELLEQQHLTNIRTLNQEHADAVKEIDERAHEAKVATVNATSNLLGQASALAGKSTVAGKAFAVAQTTIDTYKSATSAFAGMTSSIPGPVGIALGVAAAAFAVASGVANIKKILSVKVPNTSGGSGGGVPTPAAGAAPTIIAAATAQQAIQNVRVTNNPNQQPIRAYITNSDLQTNQQRNNFLNSVSTF